MRKLYGAVSTQIRIKLNFKPSHIVILSYVLFLTPFFIYEPYLFETKLSEPEFKNILCFFVWMCNFRTKTIADNYRFQLFLALDNSCDCLLGYRIDFSYSILLILPPVSWFVGIIQRTSFGIKSKIISDHNQVLFLFDFGKDGLQQLMHIWILTIFENTFLLTPKKTRLDNFDYFCWGKLNRKRKGRKANQNVRG